MAYSVTATVYKATAYTGGTAEALDAIDGDDLSDGDFAFTMTASGLSVHELDDSSGATESSPEIIAPDTNAGTKRWLIRRMISDAALPEGSIIAWQGGYYTDGSNGGYTDVLGNTASLVNARLNGQGLYVCDGSALNLAGSTIYNGSGRYLPNLTDDRFIMGDTTAGSTGGSSTMTHTHTTGSHTLTISEMPSHDHDIRIGWKLGTASSTDGCSDSTEVNYIDTSTDTTGGGASHNHGSTGAATNAENRPKFLSCFYLQQVN